MKSHELGRTATRRAVLASLLAAASLAACGRPALPEPGAAGSEIRKEPPVNKRVLIAMTSHDQKGDTGQSTGAYLPEIAHPHEVFTKAGLTVDFASVRGGRVQVKEGVVVASSGRVEGDVEAAAIEIAGVVQGNVAASDKVELKSGGKLFGDVKAPRILIADGASFKGNINMGG